MPKIPFTVSARTARLIGRENVASSKGAIIELIKNTYDADSKFCLVYFDTKYNELPEELNDEDISYLMSKQIDKEEISRFYRNNGDFYELIEDGDFFFGLEKEVFAERLKQLNTIFIIDNGDGMTQQIIRNNWMVIGTDEKAKNAITNSKRVKSGAKGIGRFALDKLGAKCEMFTKFKKFVQTDNNKLKEIIDVDEKGKPTSYVAHKWTVDWEDFEGEYKPIGGVTAELDSFKDFDLAELLANEIHDSKLKEIFDNYYFGNGTILKIQELRDNWDDYYVQEVFSDLENLIPPKEGNDFKVFLYSSQEPNKYGQVLESISDDYDYKLVAAADENQNVKITIYRNEYDIEAIDSKVFDRKAFQKHPYTLADFKEGYWETTRTFSQLMPGFKQKDSNNILSKIGDFEFTFYFMKKTFTSNDAKKFFYRRFSPNSRKSWLDDFAGIKIFRDNFRVRPYGEVGSVAFDWLGLGSRKRASPAGVAKKGGGYRVELDSVVGTINISRLSNKDFEDKSSREGIVETETFEVFKELITEIISIFEKDRAYIARELSAYYDNKNARSINLQQAQQLADRILDQQKGEADTAQEADEPPKNESPTEIALAELNKSKDEIIESLEDEQKILRGMASSGLVIASFSHELNRLNDVLGSRVVRLKNLLAEVISEDSFANQESRKNPFILLERMRNQDLKLQNWLHFSLGTARKDKRRRKNLSFKNYFANYKTDWMPILQPRGIELLISEIDDTELRMFEIDLDSILNNLLVNSIDAFGGSREDRERKIYINTDSKANEFIINYRDSGPGLSKDIINPEEIFKPLFTTKRSEHTGEEIGTGLGMWLVESIIKEYGGSVQLLFPAEGFGTRIIFPKRKDRN